MVPVGTVVDWSLGWPYFARLAMRCKCSGTQIQLSITDCMNYMKYILSKFGKCNLREQKDREQSAQRLTIVIFTVSSGHGTRDTGHVTRFHDHCQGQASREEVKGMM